MTAKVIGVGVGPGDPELITVKAIKVLKTADVICAPTSHPEKHSKALRVAKQILDEREVEPEVLELRFPMTKDNTELERAWATDADIIAEKVKMGKTVAFIVLGDPTLYSTFVYVYRNLKKRYPTVELETVPGVTSLSACAARAGVTLAEKDETLMVIPDLNSLRNKRLAKDVDNLVLMKSARCAVDAVQVLKNVGFPKKTQIILARGCTTPNEEIQVRELGEASDLSASKNYFSMLIVKRRSSGE